MSRLRRAVWNGFQSPGRQLFGPRFALDYTRVAASAALRWGDTGPGTLDFLGYRIVHANRSHAVYLLHEIFVNAAYRFDTDEPSPLILDCGANIGMATLFFKSLHAGARILAFEPEPTTFTYLARNVQENALADTRVEQAAVGARAGVGRLFVAEGDAGSITASATPSDGAREVPTAVVRLAARIDEPVAFLKLDIEGGEWEVIDDLADSGALRLVRQAVIECHEPGGGPRTEALLGRLRDAGFEAAETPAAGGRAVMVAAVRR